MTVLGLRAPPAARPVAVPVDPLCWAALAGLVVSLVFLQRLALPGGVPLVLPIGYACLGVLLLRGGARVPGCRAAAYLTAMTACTAAAIGSTATGGVPSVPSLLLLVVLYLPVVLVATGPARALHRRTLVLLERCLLVVAGLALATAAGQLAGWTYTDLLARLPSALLVQGFNTSYPAFYGSTFSKTNAVVCLEPSILSILMGLGVLLCLLLRTRRWHLVPFAGGLLASLTGSGVLLLAVGLAVLALRRGPRSATAIAATTGLVGLLVLLTPPGQLLAARVTEVRDADSSANARFVQPYANMLQELATGPRAVLVGDGPGSTTAKNAEVFRRSLRSPNDPVATKLVREYGLPAALAFGWLLVVVFGRGASPTLTTAVLMAYLVLTGGLLQPQVAYLAHVVSALFPRDPGTP